jgi:hypothetical protein
LNDAPDSDNSWGADWGTDWGTDCGSTLSTNWGTDKQNKGLYMLNIN